MSNNPKRNKRNNYNDGPRYTVANAGNGNCVVWDTYENRTAEALSGILYTNSQRAYEQADILNSVEHNSDWS